MSDRSRPRNPLGIRQASPLVGRALLAVTLALGLAAPTRAQVDPIKRRVFQAGYSLPVHEDAPVAAYGFYYLNLPDFPRTNLVLRSAIVPVYFDSELSIRHAWGPHTDLGIGLAGGGFADTYNEVRKGDYLKSESFTGHSAEGSVALYHLFNPMDQMPLHGVVRLGAHASIYERDDDTAPDFQIADDRATLFLRSGLRLGGREPYLTPKLAGELSIWNESRYRLQNGLYGYHGDRAIEEYSSLFWGRALLAYTFDDSKQFIEIGLTAGASLNPDRFSAYRLGGSLSMVSEFALTLPGYHIQEISAEHFAQLSLRYLLPLDSKKCWALNAYGSAAVVDYLDGLEQPGDLHSGIGGGILYQSPDRAWQIGAAYAYGVDAIRQGGRGAHTVTFQLQYDLDADLRGGGRPFWNPFLSANTWRGIFRAFRGK